MSSNVKNPVIIVQGGQWGSEAKGAVSAHLCLTRYISHTVRTGAINAGHTVVYEGKPYAMQQIPVGWVNPNTTLVIGAGAYIHPETLFREIEWINKAMPDRDVRTRLLIDDRCAIHDLGAEAASKLANRHHSIGATGKGCSEAIVNKIQNRNTRNNLFKFSGFGNIYAEQGGKFTDTVALLNRVVDQGGNILIEGTQGTMLDLHIGPYPYTTSRMTSAANWIAECGLAPGMNYETVMVCRTYPIRVAGNSGPMSGEIEWMDLARSINSKLGAAKLPPLVNPLAIDEFERAMDLAAAQAADEDRYVTPMLGTHANIRLSSWTPAERSEFRVAASELHRDAIRLLDNSNPETLAELRKLFEMTTVTKKLRRIAKVDWDDLLYAATINRPTWIAMTFMDYEFPELRNITAKQAIEAINDEANPLCDAIRRVCQYTGDVQRRLEIPVRAVSFGPAPDQMFSAAYLWSRRSQR